ncbi:hypothetical protein ACFL6U_21965 [Planctomycetota bacterium]
MNDQNDNDYHALLKSYDDLHSFYLCVLGERQVLIRNYLQTTTVILAIMSGLFILKIKAIENTTLFGFMLILYSFLFCLGALTIEHLISCKIALVHTLEKKRNIMRILIKDSFLRSVAMQKMEVRTGAKFRLLKYKKYNIEYVGIIMILQLNIMLFISYVMKQWNIVLWHFVLASLLAYVGLHIYCEIRLSTTNTVVKALEIEDGNKEN